MIEVIVFKQLIMKLGVIKNVAAEIKLELQKATMFVSNGEVLLY